MKKTVILLAVLLVLTAGSSGGLSLAQASPFPFTEATWDSSIEDLITLHGSEPSEEYQSNLGGPCYIFRNISYNGMNGFIRYLYNDKNELSEVFFDVNFSSAEQALQAYNDFCNLYSQKYGKSGYSMDENGVIANVWYRKNGNVGVMVSNVLNIHLLRITYASPEISTKTPPTQ